MDFGIQHGKGSDYTTILTQRSKGTDLKFEFTLTVKEGGDDEPPNFLGPLSQGPAAGRFVYIDIGKSAGQIDSCWQRRIKVPLGGITWDVIREGDGQSEVDPRSSVAGDREGWRAELCDGPSHRGLEMLQAITNARKHL